MKNPKKPYDYYSSENIAKRRFQSSIGEELTTLEVFISDAAVKEIEEERVCWGENHNKNYFDEKLELFIEGSLRGLRHINGELDKKDCDLASKEDLNNNFIIPLKNKYLHYLERMCERYYGQISTTYMSYLVEAIFRREDIPVIMDKYQFED